MRLTDFEVSSIRQTVHALDPDASIYLFGSRADDDKRGGDIDLLIISDRLSTADAGPVRWRLWELLGEQKIDIVIAKDDSEPFVRIALKEGVPL
jgi:predicted nucleotidyltransferase